MDSTKLFWYSSVAVQFLFCMHLLWTRLAVRHPIFTLYLGTSVVRSLLAMYFTAGYNSGALPLSYTYFWLWSEPVLMLLQIAVTLEVHTAMWKQGASLAKSARPLLYFAVATAVVLAALPVKAELSRFGTLPVQAMLHFEFLSKRYISTVLAVFLVLSAVMFLIAIRNNLSTNLLRHESMLAAYLTIYAIAYFAINMGWTRAILINNYLLSALTLCLVIWISMFKPEPHLAAS